MMKPFYDPLVEGTMDMQELSNTYHQISLARTRSQHRLINHYLTLYFPKMERFITRLGLNGFAASCARSQPPSQLRVIRWLLLLSEPGLLWAIKSQSSASFQSGQRQSKHEISKRGNSRLRYAYSLATTIAIGQRENSFREKYERHIKSSLNNPDLKRKAVVAIACKLARVCHSLVKQNTPYRGYYEFNHGT